MTAQTPQEQLDIFMDDYFSDYEKISREVARKRAVRLIEAEATRRELALLDELSSDIKAKLVDKLTIADFAEVRSNFEAKRQALSKKEEV